MRNLFVSLTLGLTLLIPAAAPAALNPGDIAFTLFDAENGTEEGNDQFAFVALVSIPSEETVYFTDEEWEIGGVFGTGEGTVVWTAPESGVAAGSVVSFMVGSSSVLDVTAGVVAPIAGTFNISGSGETVWAYQAEDDVPTSFLSVISTEGFGDTLDGTGLTAGVTAIELNSQHDHAQYTGARTGASSISDYLPLIVGDVENNWFQENNPSGVDFLADTTPFTVGTPGDFNTDGVVDAADYALWRNNVGEDESVLNGGGDGEDGVDSKDYDLWREHYGAGGGLVANSLAAPEPAAAMLLISSLGMLFARKSRRT